MILRQLTDNLSVYTFPSPPEDIDLNSLDERVLNHFGLSKAVNVAGVPSGYERILSGEVKLIEPEFRVTTRRHASTRLVASGEPGDRSQTPNWSGGVVFAPSASDFLWYVSGRWVVPQVTWPNPDNTRPNTAYSASMWVGIDGTGVEGSVVSTDVFQCGIEYDIGKDFLGLGWGNLYPWWEWYVSNNPAIAVSNLAVGVGDTVQCWIEIRRPGPIYNFWVQITNITRNQAVAFYVNPPPGADFKGNCAEWIVERPTSSTGKLQTLPNYEIVNFDEVHAVTKQTNTRFRGGQAALYDMTGANDLVISQVTPQGDNLQCQYIYQHGNDF